jgi:hypothetical protein
VPPSRVAISPSVSGAEPGLEETSLSFAVRLRYSLIGAALALLVLAIAVALGVLITSALFHTAPGALA